MKKGDSSFQEPTNACVYVCVDMRVCCACVYRHMCVCEYACMYAFTVEMRVLKASDDWSINNAIYLDG
jgi:hypothetical protein